MLAQQFKQRYLESLSYYKYFYDDIREYGSPDNPRRVFYFIPGFSGVAGQVRFVFPNLQARYGNDFYLTCCHLDEFSAATPIWANKSTAPKKRPQRIDHPPCFLLGNIKGFHALIQIASRDGCPSMSIIDQLLETPRGNRCPIPPKAPL